MKSGKLFVYYLLSFLAALNVMYIYLGGGYVPWSKAVLPNLTPMFVTFLMLFVSNVLVSYSYIVSRAIAKKNLLKVNLIIIFVYLIISVIGRGREIYYGIYKLWPIMNTVTLILLFVLTIMMLKDLYKLIHRLINSND